MPIVRARSIMFPVDTRTGPESAHYQRSLSLDESHFRRGVPGEEDFRVGEILIDEAAGKFTLRSPYCDKTTGEPLIVVGSLVNVSYEPLSDTQARKYYAHEHKDPTPKLDDRKVPAARA